MCSGNKNYPAPAFTPDSRFVVKATLPKTYDESKKLEGASNTDIAKSYAEGATSGHAKSGNLLIEGEAIKSYGIVLAKRGADKKVNVECAVFVNSRGENVRALNRHRGLVVAALKRAGWAVNKVHWEGQQVAQMMPEKAPATVEGEAKAEAPTEAASVEQLSL